ncbi:ribonuclease HIII [Spiroplasma sabaudiense Ar-1343]|uniref:Ribonuclease n=1 Tax=Spiroplasma sabaudiense Ar-1343 TaxID=1276257 RepID=W6AJT7_9MOLU|nr:ribonuclease HIII [Spiroplasma sabaudiense]AHI53994.1 ribonuclease HIII [Spiroplasma sabaudiense Ar-1343]
MDKANIFLDEKILIGTDEVGVGDFFGPLVVVACRVNIDDFVDKKILAQINDSKQLSDSKIYNIFEAIKEQVKYSVVIIENEKYNKIYDQVQNSHILKALGHNKALINLISNNPDFKNDKIVIDEFVNSKKYFSYLEKIKEPYIFQNITFCQKAESKYLAVACASIIARWHFLEKIKELETELKITLPLGASNDVKTLVRQYKKIHPDKAKTFIKMHFKDS